MRNETRDQYNERLRAYMAKRRNKRRDDLRALLGGRCAICQSSNDLEFDHIDPASKLFQLSGRGLDKPMPQIIDEVKKCQLLCHSCHVVKSQGENSSRVPWNKGSRNADSYGEHGVASTYSEHGCRCDSCTEAKRQYRLKLISYNEKVRF